MFRKGETLRRSAAGILRARCETNRRCQGVTQVCPEKNLGGIATIWEKLGPRRWGALLAGILFQSLLKGLPSLEQGQGTDHCPASLPSSPAG